MKRRPLARDGDVWLTIAHDDWEVNSVTGCGAMVDVVKQAGMLPKMLRLHRQPESGGPRSVIAPAIKVAVL